MKKIALLSPAHPLRGGIASSTERFAQALQEAGYQVDIISFTMQYPEFLFPGKSQYTDDPAPRGLTIKPRINSVNPLNWLAVGRELKRDAYDIIVCRYWLPFMGPALGTILRRAKGAGAIVVALTDNIVPHEKRVGDAAFTRYFLDAVDGALVMSRAVGKDFERLAPGKPYRFVPHPIYDNYGEPASREVSLQALGLLPAYRYLLFFGFVRAYKGLDILLKAMADERVRSLPVRLIVAGEFYEDEEKYQALIRELDIADLVHLFANYIPKESVRHFFGAADLVVQPYKTATQSGISQMAYHFEKPMIVTRVGGLHEIVPHGEAGYVVDTDPWAVAGAIADFFNHQRMAELRAGVAARKARFSWERLVEGMEAIIGEAKKKK